MKNYEIRIQPFSALAGAFLVVLCFVATGAFAPQGSSNTRDIDATEILNATQINNFVRILGEQSYQVPTGKKLVITGVGGTSTPFAASVFVDGVHEVSTFYHNESINGSSWGVPATTVPSILQMPTPGLVVQPGQTVTVGGGTGSRVWGYLLDA